MYPPSTHRLSVGCKVHDLRKATKLLDAHGGVGGLFLQKQPSHYKPEHSFGSSVPRSSGVQGGTAIHTPPQTLGQARQVILGTTPPQSPRSLKIRKIRRQILVKKTLLFSPPHLQQQKKKAIFSTLPCTFGNFSQHLGSPEKAPNRSSLHKEQWENSAEHLLHMGRKEA